MKRLLSCVLTGLFFIGLPLAVASTTLGTDPGTKPVDTKEEDKLKEQALLQQTQRIRVFQFFASVAVNLHPAVKRLKAQERPGANEAVTTQPFTTDHTLEEE